MTLRSPRSILLLIVVITVAAFFHHDRGHAAEGGAGGAKVDSTLAWLTGHWSNGEGDNLVEELWMEPRGGAMLGMHRDFRGGKFVFFEFLRIVEDSAGVAYVAQPRGHAPTRFGLIERGERKVVFENPAHDYPQRILYWIDEQGRLHARTEGRTAKGPRTEDWVWSRIR
jgi:hypothetical protein